MAEFTEDINNVDPARTVEARESVTSVMSEKYPNSKWEAGDQLEGVVVEPVAFGYAFNEERLDKQEASFSLAAIEADPTLADDDMVDSIMSNYFIERQQATVSFGSLLVIVSRAIIIPVADGALYDVGDQEYVTQQAWRVFPPDTRDEDLDNGILVLELRTDGNYQFLLPVQSVSTGPDTLVSRGTVFTPDVPFPGQISVTASSDFGGGLAADTNEDLLARAQEGITPKVMSGYQQIEQSIENNYPGSLVRVVGANDPLMNRDRDNLFAASTGGKADIYVRSENYPRTETLEIQAVLAPSDRSSGTWRFNYTLPGAYRVSAIRTTEDDFGGGAQAATEAVNLVPPSSGFQPKLDVFNAAFSAHQSRTVTFINQDDTTQALIDAAGPTDVLTRTFDVDVLAMPFIEDIDNYARDRDRRDPALDPLVKAACPCLVGIRAIVRGTVDAEPAKAAIVAAIAKLSADADTIPANLVYDAIEPYVVGNTSTVYYSGRFIGQDLSENLVSQQLELTIPENTARGISPDTCHFMVRSEDITIEEV